MVKQSMINTESDQGMMTLAEVSEFTRLSESRLRQLIKSGKLRVLRSNGRTGKILMMKSWVQAALASLGENHG